MKIGTTDPELLKYNALSKVPTLITDDGAYLFDSPVICENLDSIGSAPKLFPAQGPARWKALTQEALADGILDATHPRRREFTPARATLRSSRVRWRAPLMSSRSRRPRSATSTRSVRSPSAARWAISTSATPTSRGGGAIPSSPRGTRRL